MKIDLKLPPRTFIAIATALQPIYDVVTPQTRKERTALSIAFDVVEKIEKTTKSISKQPTLFDDKKKLKISFKQHEADMLEIILVEQIRFVEDPYMRNQIQSTINLLNQKLA